MARPSISNLRSQGDIVTQMNWNVSLMEPPPGIPELTTMNGDALNFRCESMDVPKWTGQSTEVWIRGHRIKQPGIYTPSGSLTLTMFETADNRVANWLKAWREACWQTDSGVQRLTSDVSATLRLVRLNRQDEEIWQYIVYGVFLEDYDPTGGTLGNQSADILRPTLTISYDWFDEGPVG